MQKFLTAFAIVGCGACLASASFDGKPAVAAANSGQSCAPSIISVDDLAKLRQPGNGPSALSSDEAANLIAAGRLVVLNQQVITLPEIQKVISDQFVACFKKQLANS